MLFEGAVDGNRGRQSEGGVEKTKMAVLEYSSGCKDANAISERGSGGGRVWVVEGGEELE